jgi:hypothetical protein
MTALADEIERTLRQARAPELLDGHDGYILPDYAGRSLANIPATLAALLGGTLPHAAPPLAEEYWRPFVGVRRVVLILLDALGYRPWNRMLARGEGAVWAGLAERGVLLPLTSVYPSTTANALMTLMTGAEPIAHGYLGYELWLREFGVLAQMLAVQPAFGTGKETLTDWGFKPNAFIPTPSLGGALAAQGIQTTGHVPAVYTSTAFSKMLYRGFTRLVGYSDLNDMWDKAVSFLRRDRDGRSLHWLYYGGLDAAMHKRGDADVPDGWPAQYRLVSETIERLFLRRLSAAEREGTLLVICADHGYVDTPVEAAHITDADPAFRDLQLVPYSGEARAAFVHTLRGDDPATCASFRRSLGDGFMVHSAGKVVEAGLFGKSAPYAEALARLGHLHIMALGQRYLDRKDRRMVLRGRHGGLAPEEMLVPWLAQRLDG